MIQSEQVVSLGNNNISVEDAARILGCSYPHVINRINHGKIKAKKIGKSWLVDAEQISQMKAEGVIRPRMGRPRTKTSDGVTGALNRMNKHRRDLELDEVELTIKIPRSTYQMISLALESGKEKKNLKQHLESVVENLHEKIQKHFSGVDLE